VVHGKKKGRRFSGKIWKSLNGEAARHEVAMKRARILKLLRGKLDRGGEQKEVKGRRSFFFTAAIDRHERFFCKTLSEGSRGELRTLRRPAVKG